MTHEGGVMNIFTNETKDMFFEERIEFNTNSMILADEPSEKVRTISLMPETKQHFHLLATKFIPKMTIKVEA